MSAAVPGRGGPPARRLVVLLVALGGLLGMHGLSPTDVAGSAHHLVPSVAQPAAAHTAHAGPTAHTGHGAHAVHTGAVAHAAASVRAALPEHPGGAGHGALAGCLLALVGLATAVVLRGPRPARAAASSLSAAASDAARRGPPRHPPPRPLLLTSLCVLRV